MNRLRQPGDSDYDVLGVSPGATEEEINSAFRRLIDGGGYKIGVPLNRQWLRAHQIKHAHASLADPAKRRAYDELLRRASTSAPWAMTADDPATDELVLSEMKAEAAAPVENGPAPVAVVPPEPDEKTLTDPEPEQVPDMPLEPDAEDALVRDQEEVESVPDEPPPPYLAAPLDEDEFALAAPLNDDEWDSPEKLNDNKRASVRRWGMAAAVASGLGLVLLLAWPEWTPQASTGEKMPSVTADGWQPSGPGPGLASYYAQASGNTRGAGASAPEAQGAPSAASAAASDAPGQPVGLQSASDEAPTPEVDPLAPTDTADVQLRAATTPAGTTPAEAGASSPPMEAAEARAVVPAPTSPVVRPPAIAPASERPARSSSIVSSPAQWVGGGPTDADNQRGRYQGTVAVQVTVEPGGRVSSCAPVRGSGNAGLDAMTCRLVQERARFTPALDAQGRPVTSQAYTTFVWGRKPRN